MRFHSFLNVRRRQGYIVILLTNTVLIFTIASVTLLFQSAFQEYRTAANLASQTKARFLAQSALEAATMVLRQVPLNILQSVPLFKSPPGMPLGDGVLAYEMVEEDGKLNVNQLVRFTDNDSEDKAQREMFDRLSESLKLSPAIWDPVIDWIDSNDLKMPRGFERLDYALLEPPRRIKNGRLHGLEELLLIPGFDQGLLYSDLRTEEEKEEYSSDFETEEEQIVIDDDDYILANNITTYLRADPRGKGGAQGNKAPDRIYINSARYHVIVALSESMLPDLAKKLLVARLMAGDSFGSIEDIKAIPEMNAPSIFGANVPIWKDIEGRIKFENQLYKIVATASVDDQTAHVLGVFDISAKLLTFYSE